MNILGPKTISLAVGIFYFSLPTTSFSAPLKSISLHHEIHSGSALLGGDSLNTATDDRVRSTTDTGAFASGNVDFSRFSLPGECVGAAMQARVVARRALSVQYHLIFLRDTAPELDSLPARVVAIARSCGSHFTVSQVDPNDLHDLFTLALIEGKDSMARAIVGRRLALASDANARQRVLADVVAGYVAAEPARLDAADQAATQADSFAMREHTNSLPAHQPLLDVARNSFDRQRIVHEAQRMIRLGQMLDFQAIRYGDLPLIYAWTRRLEVAFVDTPDSVLVLAQEAKTDLGRFPLGSHWPAGIPYRLVQTFDFKNATPVQIRNLLLPFNTDRYKVGDTLPPVRATYWYPASPTAWPPQEQLLLVVYGGRMMNCARSKLLRTALYDDCAPLHTYLPAWKAQYDSLGFALMLVAQTAGYAVRSEPLAPAMEADTLNWYFRTYLRLPVTLGVVQQAVTDSDPDGRRWYTDTTAFGRHAKSDYGESMVLLFRRDGTLLYAGKFDQALLSALIVREVHAVSAQGNLSSHVRVGLSQPQASH
jgi:hypothetical protein